RGVANVDPFVDVPAHVEEAGHEALALHVRADFARLGGNVIDAVAASRFVRVAIRIGGSATGGPGAGPEPLRPGRVGGEDVGEITGTDLSTQALTRPFAIAPRIAPID